MSRIIVIGAGGHGRVVAEAAVVSGEWSDVVFLDDRYPGLSSVDGYPVVGSIEQLRESAQLSSVVTVALGDNVSRVQVIEYAISLGYSCPPVIHPAAYVSSGAQIGPGTVVMAHAVVGVGTTLSLGCIANTGCTIDHDCRVENGVHIAPGANVAGGVHIGKFSWIGIGATINQEIIVGDNVLVGASAAVIADVPSGARVAGVPARSIKG